MGIPRGGTRKLRFYVLASTVRAVPLLGVTACDQMNLIKRIEAAVPESSDLEEIRRDPIAREYLDLFSGVGKMENASYAISLRAGTQPYVLGTARRVPFPLYDKVHKELQRMLQFGVIQEVSEPTSWCSPMVAVPKGDGTVRICVDYTSLNESVQREHYQLPLAEEIFVKVKGAKFFTTLDAAAGFWQIPLAPSSSELTTFITPFGRYRFTRLPFGLSSGPEVFHKVMQEMLRGIEGTDCFIDDVLVWGATSEEHDRRLCQVLSMFRERGVRLQPAKCKFRQSKVTYYGHDLSAEGIRVSEAKLQALTKMKRPENKEEVRRFLGMIAYVAKFLEGLSQVSAPIRALLHDDVIWDWTSVHVGDCVPETARHGYGGAGVGILFLSSKNHCFGGCVVIWSGCCVTARTTRWTSSSGDLYL